MVNVIRILVDDDGNPARCDCADCQAARAAARPEDRAFADVASAMFREVISDNPKAIQKQNIESSVA